eukprot:187031_1
MTSLTQLLVDGYNREMQTVIKQTIPNGINKLIFQQFSNEIFKIIVVGNPQVGKTSFIRSHNRPNVANKVLTEVEKIQILIQTNIGIIELQCWDSAGTKCGTLPDEYFLHAKGAILMFDVTNRLSYKNLPVWYRDIVRGCEYDIIPIVLCGNKVDNANERRVKSKHIRFHRKKNLQYYDISVKSFYNLHKPFLCIIKKLFGDHTITIISKIRECTLPKEMQSKYERDMQQSLFIGIPDDDSL